MDLATRQRKMWPQAVRRTFNTLKRFVSQPHRPIGWVFLVFAGYLIVLPVVEILLSTIRVQERDIRRLGAAAGEWTVFYWERALNSQFSQRLFYQPLINTLVVGICYTVLAMSIGVALAWLLVRTDLPFKKFFSSAILIPYILPSWTIALAWLTVFRNDQIGIGAPGLVQALTGLRPPAWLAYGPVPITFSLSISYFAFSYLLAAAALSSIDASLEDASRIHGATLRAQMRYVTLPLILPALGSAFILTFAHGIGTFGVPAFLGIPARYYLLATSLYDSANTGRFGEAFVMSIVLIALAVLTIAINARVIGSRRQFTTLSGKGSHRRLVSLGKWRIPVAGGMLAFVFCAGFVPVLLLLIQSLQLRLGSYSFSNLSLEYWIGNVSGYDGILLDPRIRAATGNSLLLGISVATGTAFIGVLVGYVVVKARGTWLSKWVEQVSFLPYLIPGIAFGAIYLTMWAQPRGPLPALYGTFALLALAALVNRLPYAARTGTSAMIQVGPSLEEAAEVHGAGFFSRFRLILFPLTRRGFLAGFMLSFISTIKDLSLVVLLVTPTTMLLPVMTLQYSELGRPQFANAVAVMIAFVVLFGTWLARRISRADPIEGFGGARE